MSKITLVNRLKVKIDFFGILNGAFEVIIHNDCGVFDLQYINGIV